MIWLGALTLVGDVLLLFSKSSLPWKEVLVTAVAAGISTSQLRWSDLKSKFGPINDQQMPVSGE
jgi:hypothetical protein